MSLATARKAVVSVIALGGAALALVLNKFDPSFTQTCIALAGAVFGVLGVWASKNHTFDDLSKSVAQLQAAALTVVGYFTVVPTSTVEKITLLVGAALSALAVFAVRNDGAPERPR